MGGLVFSFASVLLSVLTLDSSPSGLVFPLIPRGLVVLSASLPPP